jgi:hypothetical protein
MVTYRGKWSYITDFGMNARIADPGIVAIGMQVACPECKYGATWQALMGSKGEGGQRPKEDSMKVKTLICSGKGLDPYRFADMNSLALEVASEFDISYAAVHPQLSTEGGNQVLQEVLRSAEDDSDTYVMVCAGADDARTKLFKQAVCDIEFDSKNCLSAEMREMIDDSILERIGERLKKQADSNFPRH